MLASTSLLRRLFTKRPSPEELEFHWWFLTGGGMREWHRHLAAHGFLFSRRTRIIRRQELAARKLLETWDTERFYTWVTTRKAPAFSLAPILDPEALPHVAGHGMWDDETCSAPLLHDAPQDPVDHSFTSHF